MLTEFVVFWSLCSFRAVLIDVIGQSTAEAVPLSLLASSAHTASALLRPARSNFTVLVPRSRLIPSCATFSLVLPVPVLHVLETRSQFFFGGHTTDSYVASQSPMRNAVDLHLRALNLSCSTMLSNCWSNIAPSPLNSSSVDSSIYSSAECSQARAFPRNRSPTNIFRCLSFSW